MDLRQKIRDLRTRLFPPVSRSSFLRHYIPTSGGISHTAFSIHIFAPHITNSLFPTYDLAVSNTMLFTSHIGIGFYVFFRKHQIRLKMWDRIEFSVITSVLFNFGSLMFSVLLKQLLPKRLSTSISALIGASLSTFLLTRGIKYMNQIDARTVIPLNNYSKPAHIPPISNHQKKQLTNGHLPKNLPTIVEHKSITNGHLPQQVPELITKEPIQFVTPSVELRTSA